MKVKLLSRVRLVVTPWTAAYQAPQSMRFSRQEYWSGYTLPLFNLTIILENKNLAPLNMGRLEDLFLISDLLYCFPQVYEPDSCSF